MQKGAILRQEHGWFWIRSGEQRICVGCHTGPERASENRVPAVLLRTTTPVDLSGAKIDACAERRREAIEMDYSLSSFIRRRFHSRGANRSSAPAASAPQTCRATAAP